MRYPIRWFLPVTLAIAAAHAADAPAAPVSASASPKPTAATSPLVESAAPKPAPAASDKPIPVTKPIDLFNGKDLAGWSYIASGQPADIAGVVQVKDGVMAVSGRGRGTGYIELPEIRENYQLHVEWRWPAENPKNNGGVLIHVSPGALQQGLWPVSFQFQTKVQRAGDFIVMAAAKCAEITPPAVQADRKKDASEKATGEWNSVDITVRGDTIECTVNGVAQNKITKCVPSSGKIGFMLEGYPFEMRNIKLSPLEPEKPAAKPAGS